MHIKNNIFDEIQKLTFTQFQILVLANVYGHNSISHIRQLYHTLVPENFYIKLVPYKTYLSVDVTACYGYFKQKFRVEIYVHNINRISENKPVAYQRSGILLVLQ